jgi:hypothetical protein
MFKHLLKSIEGIQIWAIIPLIIFVSVFLFVIVSQLLTAREKSKEIAAIPLSDGTISDDDTPLSK